MMGWYDAMQLISSHAIRRMKGSASLFWFGLGILSFHTDLMLPFTDALHCDWIPARSIDSRANHGRADDYRTFLCPFVIIWRVIAQGNTHEMMK